MRILLTLVLYAAMVGHLPAMAGELVAPKGEQAKPIRLADAFCHTVGVTVAEQRGGRLAKATPRVVAGRKVCVLVLLLPARDGKRPRRVEMVVPQ